MIAIADYGMGNLRSVQKAVEYLGYSAVISDDASRIRDANGVILPGVGAAADAMRKLESSGLGNAVSDAAARKVPILGICLGMQLLFEKSYENGITDCLGLIKGDVVPFDAERTGDLVIPHMGWNNLLDTHGLLKGLGGSYMYFVHSYHAEGVSTSQIDAVSTYGYPFVCAVSSGSVHGVQFHPEKSGKDGLSVLERFVSTFQEEN